MSLANDMTLLLNKIERRNGLTLLNKHLPVDLKKENWSTVVLEDTLPTFSRFLPYALPMVVNDETCYKKKGRLEGTDNTGTHGALEDKQYTWYYIKDEVLEGNRLLGIKDIDFQDHTTNNSSFGATSLGGGYYYPSYACPEATFESVLALQFNADMASLYNRGVYIDFQYPSHFRVCGLGNVDYDLSNFVVTLLIEHKSLSTISPTEMETFESLASADVCNWLYKALRFYDGLETAYLNLDLKLTELQEEANKREQIIDFLRESYVGWANTNQDMIWSV